MLVARAFLERRCLHNGAADALTIRYSCGSWWMWQTTHWVESPPHAVRSLLYEFTADAVYRNKDAEITPWSPTRHKIADMLEALSALVLVPDHFEQPCWLDGRKTGPIAATANGLLDVASQRLNPHTPLYFGQVSVPFAYNPDAPDPTKWLEFLDELWLDEPDSIAVLGEWFGYVISGHQDLQKIFLNVGPTRSGKGTIARVLTAMVGRPNVAGPTLNSLGGEFGLAPLIGKPLAIISDARFVGKNGNVVVERLLSISGEDTITVNRKYRDQWTGKLPSRLHIVSNELPKLGDASEAIVDRFILLPLSRSWLGKEDHTLEPKLHAELPAILNWALAGLKRLTIDNLNRFTRVASAEDAIAQMRDLASPVAAFVREKCKLDCDEEIGVDTLYAEYKLWCGDNEYPKASKHMFGRDLRAGFPSIKKQRPRVGQDRRHVYSGIRFRVDNDD